MDTADFAESVLDKKLRENLVTQVKEQLSGMDKVDATNEPSSIRAVGLLLRHG